jgi:hypothetical protein
VRGVAPAASAGSPDLLVVAADADGHQVLTVPAAALTLRPVQGLDPALGLISITGGVEASPSASTAPADWSAAVRRCQLAIGHELVGASRRMLDLAREHALERVQFGVPIASFQAVRHRLAETFVALEAADAVLDAAWEDGAAHTAAMAKALAGRGARTATRHCQQVLAGIGFTLEHEFHRHLRRVLVLDELFGSARALTKELGEELARTRELPPILPL